MFKEWFIRKSNALTARRRVKVAPEHLLLLLPHCMQWSGCAQNVREDIANCKQCGKCRVGDMKALAAKYGVRCVVVGGGRRAVEEVRRESTHAVVAVACEKELVAGVLATLPKPVLAVNNTRPCGACRDTSVDPDEVEKAIRSLLFFPFLYSGHFRYNGRAYF